jgi:hypothetical protein
MEWASLIVSCDERTIFVIDVHSFCDEISFVTECNSFYDEPFSSLNDQCFRHKTPSVGSPDGVCHAGSWHVLCTWHIHVTVPTGVAWHVSYAWLLMWHVTRRSILIFIEPRGSVWLVHVADSDWCTFIPVIGSHFRHSSNNKIVTHPIK